MNVSAITHPSYDREKMEKWRLTYQGGFDFIDKYLKQYSTRETAAEFQARKAMTYCPAHAKAAIIDIKNAIFQRMVEIVRYDAPSSLDFNNVDRQYTSMNSFIGAHLLPELLIMGRVGVYIDKQVGQPRTKLEAMQLRPYLYYYTAEQIRSWARGEDNTLTSVLLEDNIDEIDFDTGLVIGKKKQYRLLTKHPEGVLILFYDTNGNPLSQTILPIKTIPFVIIEITESLLTDVADYQIALLNIESSDIAYITKANFPFYTEQYNPLAVGIADQEIEIGVAQGRRYPNGLERPGFIHPSSEPLTASMEKQKQLREDIRKLINLSIANLDPRRASAESKDRDQESKEEGLSYIGLQLETAERQIVAIWAEYDGQVSKYTVQYPTTYDLRDDSDRRAEANDLRELLPIIPSKTYQQAIARQIAHILLKTKITREELNMIDTEIKNAEVIVTDPEIVRSDHEAGFVSTELASKLRGYPKGEVEQAKKDHAERAARIALAQSEAGARGVADLSTDPDAGKKEKENVRNARTS